MPTQHQLYKAAKLAVDSVDPIGLLALGCPSDEYDIEAKDIAERIKRDDGRLTVDTVRHVFWHWFHAHVPHPVARRIVEITQLEVQLLQQSTKTSQ